MQLKKHMHYPTMRTVLMVEDVLKNAELCLFRNEILRRLPRKVDRQTLNTILAYLAERHLILEGSKGVLWIGGPMHPSLKKLMDEGIEV